MSDDSYLFSANGDIHKLALNDKCVQTDFTEKKNYTIVQFKAYQIRHGKASLKCEVSSKPTGSSQPKKVEKKKHPCSLCDKVFSRSDTLKKHVRTSHSGVAYPQPVAFEASCSSNQHGSQAKIETERLLNNNAGCKQEIRDLTDLTNDCGLDYEDLVKKRLADQEDSRVDMKPEAEHVTSESTSEKLKYKCKDCGKMFHRSYNLRRHVIIHSEKRPFNCEFCEKGFNRIDLLRRHVVGCYLKTDEGKQRYGRKISQQLLDELDQRVRKQAKPCNRMLAKTGKSREKRTAKVISSDTDDDGHINRKDDSDVEFMGAADYDHNVIDDGDSNDDDEVDIKQALCFVDVTMNETHPDKNLASFSYNVKPEYKHDGSSSKSDINDTIISDDTSDSEYEVKISKLTTRLKTKNIQPKNESNDKNSDSEGSDADGAEFKCTDCGKVFTRERNLRRHAIVHSETRPYTCEFCQKGFNRYDNLRQHIVSCYLSTDEGKSRYGSKRTAQLVEELEQRIQKQRKQSFNCKICGEECNSYKQLIEHRKIHTSEKPYACSECDAGFKRPSDLSIHMRIHTGERPFKCKFCDKGFKSANDARCHERHHTGEKPHLCSICGKSYLKGYNLSVHMKTHTGENQDQCPYCPKKFNRPNDLKVHMRRHTGDFLTCDICGDNFTRKYHLKRHRYAKHDIPLDLKETLNVSKMALDSLNDSKLAMDSLNMKMFE